MWNPMDKIVAFASDKSGNIGLMAALSSPLLVFSLALGVDYGHLTLERRALQQTSDLAAIVAVADINNAETAVLNFLATNNRNLGVRTGNQVMTKDGIFASDSKQASFQSIDGYVVLTKGRYVADSSTAVSKRFAANETPFDAVSVTSVQKTRLYFASAFSIAPQISAKSKSTTQKTAAFSVGSRLASLDEGILNAVLGAMLGTKLTLKAMDYNALLDADVDAFKFADSLALRLGLTAGNYEDVLKSDISYGTFLAALADTKGLTPSVSAIVTRLKQSLNKTQIHLSLAEILRLDPYRSRPIGSSNTLVAKASVFDLINAAAAAANGGKQVAVDLGATVPGLASIRLNLAIGEPPIGTPSLAAGTQGSIVRTAQTRISVISTVDGLAALAGIKLQVPIFVDVAHAEAALSQIACLGGAKNNASVKVAVVPGVAEIALGNVDDTAFDNFGSMPRVAKATIVNSPMLKVTALGHVDADNMSKETLTFQPSEILSGKVKSVSTRDTLTSLTTSLLGNLDLDIKILLITIGSPKAVQSALAATLAKVTQPLDTVLYNTLLLLGVRIGEADVRVTGVNCQRPVLVQ
jgi:uncharacterized membrane protein